LSNCHYYLRHGKTTESVYCTITGRVCAVHMRHMLSARTLQHVTVPIRNINLVIIMKNLNKSTPVLVYHLEK